VLTTQRSAELFLKRAVERHVVDLVLRIPNLLTDVGPRQRIIPGAANNPHQQTRGA
jgi:hypothetical protein